MANSESTDEDAALPLPQHRVPHGGRIVAALDPQPWARRLLVRGHQARLDQLPSRRDLTRVGVDEEDGHSGPA